MMSRIGNKQGTGYRVQGTEKKLNPEPRILKLRKGFTLIEVLLTVLILAIGLMGVLRSYAVAVNVLGVSQENVDAVSLLKQKMAEIEQTALEEEGIQSGMSAKGEFPEAFSEFQWEWETQSTSTQGLNEVALTVYRKDHPRRFSLVTYVENKEEK